MFLNTQIRNIQYKSFDMGLQWLQMKLFIEILMNIQMYCTGVGRVRVHMCEVIFKK